MPLRPWSSPLLPQRVAVVVVVDDGEVDWAVESARSDPLEHPVMITPIARATVMG